RNLTAAAPGLLGDLRIVGGDDHAREPLGLARRGQRVADQREPAERHEVLAGQALGAAAGRDDGEGAGRVSYSRTHRRSAEDRTAARQSCRVFSPSQPSHAGAAVPRTQSRKWRASSTYMSLSWQEKG